VILIEQLDPAERKSFFSRTLKPWEHGCAERRREFRDRYDIATDSYDSQIAARIGETHVDREVIGEMTRWSVGFFNLWKRCARKIAVAYKRKPERRIDDDKDASEKLVDLYRRIGFDAFALEWQRLSIIMNRIIVLVVPRKGEEGEDVIDFEVVTGADSEVWIDPQRSVYGVPDIVATVWPTRGWQPQPGEPVLRTVDAKRLCWWDSNYELITSGTWAPIEHGMRTFPGADMLSAHSAKGDWWDWKTWRAATRATIEVGLIGASMGWTRKTQCRKIIALLHNSEEDTTPDGQNLTDHERPLVLRGLQFLVQDLNTGVEGFVKHITTIQDEIAEQMTGAASTMTDPDPSLPNAGVGGVAQFEAIKEVREGQVARLDRFEARMAMLVNRLATRINDPDALDTDIVEEGFRITWSELAFMDTPDARVRVWVEETKLGVSSPIRAVMERDGVSHAEAKRRVLEMITERAEVNEIQASRNVATDPTAPPTAMPLTGAPGESIQEMQGRAGGSFDGQGNPTVPDAANGDPAVTQDAPPVPTAPDGSPLPTGPAGPDVQALALNGAQIASLMEMATAVAEKRLPLELIARLLPIAIPTIDEATARRLLEPLQSFEAPKPEPPKFPGKPPGADAPSDTQAPEKPAA
jgi:hypothetical protein